ncbi:tetratricopeptide repeat protein [Oceanicola sp. 22II-s10i]|uniref:tetratricopeptide repeat protein n=1 Tax=Oceanicola sp. 22II-s10i TaxID=1317116 RepID=UPI001595F2F7|nr:SEL1-like repeat protein [Oceanicola sp. 22II-s10i]
MTFSTRAILLVGILLHAGAVAAQDTSAAAGETPPATTGQADPLPEMAEIEQAWRRGDFTTVRAGLKRLAEEAGTPLAQYRYGRVLFEGRGGPRDVEGAMAWLQKAVDQNQADAATLLARILLSGESAGTTRDVPRAAALLQRAATRGDAEAQYYLGLLLRTGQTGAPDPEGAFNWLLAAAEQDHLDAAYQLSQMYARGEGTAADTAQALAWLTKAAEAGHMDAQYDLANALASGQEVGQDLPAALGWYRRAAEAGQPLAQRSLGTYYMTGAEGIEPDGDEALRWLNLAAQAGDPGAMHNLGIGHLEGTVLAQDDALAAQWFARAAEEGLARSMTQLAGLKETGRGTEVDMAGAVTLYRTAVERGDPGAALRLARLTIEGRLDGMVAPQSAVPWVHYAMSQGEAGAEDWLQARADEGMRAAQAALGLELAGREGQQAEGVALLTKAAEAGEIVAQLALGEAWARGEYGLTQDYVQAHAWLNMAAASGHAAAAERRDVVAQLMTPEQIAEAQAMTRRLFAAQTAPKADQTVRTDR